jgi:hypothetical protein
MSNKVATTATPARKDSERSFFRKGASLQKMRPFFAPRSSSHIQRKCSACEQEELQRNENKKTSQNEAPSVVHNALTQSGMPLDQQTQSFMSERFAYDFSHVKIHNNTVATKSAAAVNALAYTNGNNIVFNEGQYQPSTSDGKKLLAHELTHVIQQGKSTNTPVIQRTLRRGQDHAGSFEFDDQACTMEYDQNWFFQFPASMNDAQRNTYMGSAESEIESTWSHKHRLMPTSASCPCHTNGVDVNVDLHTSREARRGRHGYTVDVRDNNPRAHVNPVGSSVTLANTDDVPQNMGASQPMPVIAHEFGHTLGITDEYAGWNHFWDFFGLGMGATDRDSLMNLGNQVRPRHYQHFADMISNVIENCQYQPQGLNSRILANPVVQTGIGGALSLDNADFILDLQVDRRLGNTDALGLFTPRIGYRALLNVSNGDMMSGPTLSFSVNRLAHPVYLNMATGLLFDPEDPGRPATLNIPLSVTAGIRRDGFTAGINYTGLVDVLGNRGYTHMVGLTFTFDR